MPGILTNALKEFELGLDELSSNLEFVRTAGRLRPRLKDMLRWEGMDGDAKKLATSFLGQRAAEESLLYRGMVVSLSGAFEQFVRRILRDGVLAINGSGLSYDALDEGIKKQNVYRTGIAFGTIHEPLDYLELDYEALAKNIGTCHGGSRQAVLNADAFIVFLSIISPDNIVKALERIGVKLQWDELGKGQTLRAILDRSDSRETAKAIQDRLKRFGQTRNKIAHAGSGGVVVTESDFEQLLAFFRIFARALVPVVESQLAKHLRK
jgi:hypothetical protein